MNKKDFEKKLKENWFNSLKVGQKIMVKQNGTKKIYEINHKDMAFKTIMVMTENDQMLWVSYKHIYPLPEHMDTELYRTLLEIEIDE